MLLICAKHQLQGGSGARCAPDGEREGQSRLASTYENVSIGSTRGKAASHMPTLEAAE
jgi:hypothetical protein